MNVLSLTYRPEDDQHGELHASAEALGFRGRGAAWFSRSELIDFSVQLGDHPLATRTPVTLAGGIGRSPDGGPEDAYLTITVRPLGATGRLLVSAELMMDAGAYAGEVVAQRATLSLVTDHASMDRFRATFVAMLAAGGESALVGLEI